MKTKAFSLVEVLVVMGIVALLAVVAAPAVETMLRGSSLTQGSSIVQAQLSFARQTALSRNRMVEVRFFQYGDSDVPGESSSNPTSGKFRAMEVFLIDDDNLPKPAGKLQILPISVIMDSGAGISSIFDQTRRSILDADSVSLPKIGTRYKYFAIRFRPDGSTDLAPTGGLWFLTLHAAVKGDNLSSSQLPANYCTVQIDPVNGLSRTFRP